MGVLQRCGAVASALALAACGQSSTPGAPSAAHAPASAAPAAAATAGAQPIWFICDGMDAPTILVISEPDARKQVTIREYDKASAGALIRTLRYTVGDADPGAGQVYYVELVHQRAAGHLHALLERSATVGDAEHPPGGGAARHLHVTLRPDLRHAAHRADRER